MHFFCGFGSSREELAYINNNELGGIANLALSPLPPPPPCDGCVYRLHALPFTSLSHLNGQHTHVLLLYTNTKHLCSRRYYIKWHC